MCFCVCERTVLDWEGPVILRGKREGRMEDWEVTLNQDRPPFDCQRERVGKKSGNIYLKEGEGNISHEPLVTYTDWAR